MQGEDTREFATRLAECDDLIDGEPAKALELAKALAVELASHRDKISGYRFRNLQMRLKGVLGTALLATGRSQKAADVLLDAKTARAVAPAERAALALRLAHLHTERFEWLSALAEAELAIRQFKCHPPRPPGDGRSFESALVTRANVLTAARSAGATIPGIEDLATDAEMGYRLALKKCTARTPKTAVAALTNLGVLAVYVWWNEPHGFLRVNPANVVADMKVVCQRFCRLGYGRKSCVHAKARWILAIAIAERFGWLNRAAEQRLLNVLDDLLELGAMADAARLCLDMCHLYYRESRWEDMAMVTATVLYHSQARKLPKSWYEALMLWEVTIEKGEVEKTFADVFEKIRGFRIRLPKRAMPNGNVHVPRQRYGDREDTGGL